MAMPLESERGSAMMEFVLSLPFLWLIIALSLGFAAGVLSRHRAAVVVREHALTSPANTSMPQREVELLRAVRLSGAYSAERTGDGLQGAGDLKMVLGLLANVSNAHKLCFEGVRKQTVNVLPDIAFSTCIEVDSNFWTYEETKDQRAPMMAATIGGSFFFTLLGALF